MGAASLDATLWTRLELLPHKFEVRGIGRSAVNGRFVVGSRRRLGELMRLDLHGLRTDRPDERQGHFAEHVVLAAVGTDAQGRKQVLGLREGATENAAGCKALLATTNTLLIAAWNRPMMWSLLFIALRGAWPCR